MVSTGGQITITSVRPELRQSTESSKLERRFSIPIPFCSFRAVGRRWKQSSYFSQKHVLRYQMRFSYRLKDDDGDMPIRTL